MYNSERRQSEEPQEKKRTELLASNSVEVYFALEDSSPPNNGFRDLPHRLESFGETF